MDKIVNNEIVDSFKISIKKKIDSSIYGTFIVYWLIFHWNFIFTMFFVSEDKIWNSTSLFKNDYLILKFFNFGQGWFYFLWILPAIFTYLTIWIFPKYITIPAFRKEEEDDTEKMIFKLTEQKKIIVAQTALEKETTKKISAEVETVRNQQKIKEIDPTIGWGEEYDLFKKTTYFALFNIVLESIYDHYGRTSWANAYNQTTNVSKDILAYLDTHGLIVIDNTDRTMALTDKGKFFVAKFTGER